MADPVRVLVVEDHPLYRHAIAALVSGMDGWEVVAACGDATSALSHAPEADVAVLDLGLPDMDGTVVLSALLERASDLRVLVLTMSEDPTALAAVLRHGARTATSSRGPSPRTSSAACARSPATRSCSTRPSPPRCSTPRPGRPPPWTSPSDADPPRD